MPGTRGEARGCVRRVGTNPDDLARLDQQGQLYARSHARGATRDERELDDCRTRQGLGVIRLIDSIRDSKSCRKRRRERQLRSEMHSSELEIAIVGATGAVGAVALELLAERAHPANKIRLLASKRSHGKQIEYCGESLTVQRRRRNLSMALMSRSYPHLPKSASLSLRKPSNATCW